MTRTPVLAYVMDWLTVAGLTCVAGGTFAQAWGALKVYKSLLVRLPDAARQALEANTRDHWLRDLFTDTLKSAFIPVVGSLAVSLTLLRFYWRIISDIPRNLVRISDASGQDKDVAVRVAELIRTAATWYVVSLGATLALAAGVIQLLLAYGI